uniref:Peptidase S1 domain-containing protein n=1 Tax=Oncorhynchus tshawytscha TaxID=74940 RepID=A0A8C8BXM8_ONCTS
HHHFLLLIITVLIIIIIVLIIIIVIRRIILHSQYDQFTSDYDIALLELSTPVYFNDLVQPVCVPASSHAFTTGTSCHVTGWGLVIVHTTFYKECSLASLLQEATVKIINRNNCNKLYEDAVTPRMLCAGNLQGGVDACQVCGVCLFCHCVC